MNNNQTIVDILKGDVIIYCDGACSNNPGEAGSGISIYSSNNIEPILLYGNYIKEGTNNIAELNALYISLLICSSLIKKGNFKNINIYSDSRYSIDCIVSWAYTWKSKGWIKKGGIIKNLELIKLAHNLYDDIKSYININHVKAHNGNEGNELADRMAVNCIKIKNIEYKTYKYNNIKDVLKLTSY